MINRIEGGALVQQSQDNSFTSINSNQEIIQHLKQGSLCRMIRPIR
jgi:hypothetical protein